MFCIPLDRSNRFRVAGTARCHRILQHGVILRLRWWYRHLVLHELLPSHFLLRPQIHTGRSVVFQEGVSCILSVVLVDGILEELVRGLGGEELRVFLLL